MTTRITRQELQQQVNIINKHLNRNLEIDAYTPDHTTLYKLTDAQGKDYPRHRMTASEFRSFLDGMLEIIDLEPTLKQRLQAILNDVVESIKTIDILDPQAPEIFNRLLETKNALITLIVKQLND